MTVVGRALHVELFCVPKKVRHEANPNPGDWDMEDTRGLVRNACIAIEQIGSYNQRNHAADLCRYIK